MMRLPHSSLYLATSFSYCSCGGERCEGGRQAGARGEEGRREQAAGRQRSQHES
jgi:hypothetical protein